jgi:hypothetical protein
MRALRTEDDLVYWVGRSTSVQQLSIVKDVTGSNLRLTLTEVYKHFRGDAFFPPAANREGKLAPLKVALFKADIHLIFNLPDGQHGEVLV